MSDYQHATALNGPCCICEESIAFKNMTKNGEWLYYLLQRAHYLSFAHNFGISFLSRSDKKYLNKEQLKLLPWLLGKQNRSVKHY